MEGNRIVALTSREWSLLGKSSNFPLGLPCFWVATGRCHPLWGDFLSWLTLLGNTRMDLLRGMPLYRHIYCRSSQVDNEQQFFGTVTFHLLKASQSCSAPTISLYVVLTKPPQKQWSVLLPLIPFVQQERTTHRGNTSPITVPRGHLGQPQVLVLHASLKPWLSSHNLSSELSSHSICLWTLQPFCSVLLHVLHYQKDCRLAYILFLAFGLNDGPARPMSWSSTQTGTI